MIKLSEISKNKIKKWLVSPFGAAAIPLFLMIVALLFPPLTYEHSCKEK